MKILKGSITALASEGRITLQIPQFSIGGPGMEVETEEVPDNWVILLHSNKCPALGKESGFTFLTKIGWEANKDKIKEAYTNAKFQRGSWEKFELYVIDHFKLVEKRSNLKIQLLEKKVKQLKESMI